MKWNINNPPLPSVREMLSGTWAFGKSLTDIKTLTGMVKEVTRTHFNQTTHLDLNRDQEWLLEEYAEKGGTPKYIAVLVPWFQLDGTSLKGIKKTLNDQWIPAYVPTKLPSGKDAVWFKQHPDVLVENIVQYVAQIQRTYPNTEILLIGHSYGGPQALHAAKYLWSPKKKVTPITIAWVLWDVGPMAQAVHALYYRIPSHVLSGKDTFISEAREIQQSQKQGITFIDTNDGYLPIHVQAWVHTDSLDNNPRAIVSSVKSPGHYKQGVDAYFSRYIVDRIMKRLWERESTTQ